MTTEDEQVSHLGRAWRLRPVCSSECPLTFQSIYEAASYLATVTLSKLSELFSSARDIMEWLSTCAGLVAKEGQPMSWVTPLGLPVVQPYRRESGKQVGPGLDVRLGRARTLSHGTFLLCQVRTLVQTVVLVDCNDDLPVSHQRQRSAFPPNFVHSLDSTHMLMTTLKLKVGELKWYMFGEGLT
jgi:DNA-directed RNA polymerase, mitochondrial